MIVSLLHILYIILLPLFGIVILYKCLTTFFHSIPKRPILYVTFTLYYFFQLVVELQIIPSPLITLLCNFLFILSLSMICKRNMKQCFLFSSLICSIWMLLEILVNVCLSFFSFKYIDPNTAGTVCSNLLMFLLIVMLQQLFFQKKLKNIAYFYWLILLLIPFSSIFMIHLIYQLHLHKAIFYLLLVMGILLLLLINFILFETFDYFVASMQSQRINLFYEKQLNSCNQQISDYVSQYQAIRELNHDLKKHFTCVRGMLNEGHYIEADTYLLHLLQISSPNIEGSISQTGNVIIDSLLTSAKNTCATYDINLETNVCIPSLLPIQNEHLCIIIGNLLENAIEACSHISKEKRVISFQLSYDKEILCLNIKNSYCNPIKKDKSGTFISSKSGDDLHGFGLTSVQNAIRTYQGEFLTEYDANLFQVTVVLYPA